MVTTMTSGNSEFDYQIKIILIGKAGVGKTSLLQRYANDKFSFRELSTVAFYHAFRDIKVKDKKIKIGFWDTGGQEVFRSIVSNYYRHAHGVVVVYDVTDPRSFDDIAFWENDFAQFGPQEFVKILIGNKCDLVDKRKISTETGKMRAAASGTSFYETSAKDNLFVDVAFRELATKILENETIIASIESKQNNLTIKALDNPHHQPSTSMSPNNDNNNSPQPLNLNDPVNNTKTCC